HHLRGALAGVRGTECVRLAYNSNMRRAAALSISLALGLASPAFADTVWLKDGRKLEGSVAHRDGKVVVTLRKGVDVILDPGEIDKVEVGESLRDVFEKKKADLIPGDPEPRYMLAQWCKENGLAPEWR